MRPPIFVYEPNDLDVFESVEAAERYIEPIDVKNDEFTFFDSEGRVLNASVVIDTKGIERTVIDDTEDQFNKSELKRILVDFLMYLGYSESELSGLQLSQLVCESLKYQTR